MKNANLTTTTSPSALPTPNASLQGKTKTPPKGGPDYRELIAQVIHRRMLADGKTDASMEEAMQALKSLQSAANKAEPLVKGYLFDLIPDSDRPGWFWLEDFEKRGPEIKFFAKDAQPGLDGNRSLDPHKRLSALAASCDAVHRAFPLLWETLPPSTGWTEELRGKVMSIIPPPPPKPEKE